MTSATCLSIFGGLCYTSLCGDPSFIYHPISLENHFIMIEKFLFNICLIYDSSFHRFKGFDSLQCLRGPWWACHLSWANGDNMDLSSSFSICFLKLDKMTHIWRNWRYYSLKGLNYNILKTCSSFLLTNLYILLLTTATCLTYPCKKGVTCWMVSSHQKIHPLSPVGQGIKFQILLIVSIDDFCFKLELLNINLEIMKFVSRIYMTP